MWSSARDVGRSILASSFSSLSITCFIISGTDVITLTPIGFGSSTASTASLASINFADGFQIQLRLHLERCTDCLVNCFRALLPHTKRDVWVLDLGKEVVQRAAPWLYPQAPDRLYPPDF